MKKYLIVGGVAGGASTAARLRRNDESAEIILFERGKYISYANCGLPYYLGGVIKDRKKLFVQTAGEFGKRFKIDVRTRNEVLSIDPLEKKVRVKNLETWNEYEESYDKLVLSPGAKPILPPVPGTDLPGIFLLRNVEDTDQIKHFLEKKKPRRALVIGAGFIGIEMVENLHNICSEVSLVEMADRVLPFFDLEMAAALYRHIKSHGVQVYLQQRITNLARENEEIIATLDNGKNIKTDLVIIAAGIRPDTAWLQNSGLALTPNGSIMVNDFLLTNDENIYAVGDAIQTKHQILRQDMNAYLAGPASKQGRIVADNIIYGNKRRYCGVTGNAILKVFDLTAGIVGASEQQLKKHQLPYRVSVIHTASNAGYYPDALPLTIKLLFTPDTGNILGAQIIGFRGVDKRLDVVSAFIQLQGTVFDLAEFEHSYAPPYSSARDPLTIAGFVAENMIGERFRSIDWTDLDKEEFRQAQILDVRTDEEIKSGMIKGSIHIPLDDLRDRLKELPADKDIIVYCRAGLRGYLACRLLTQNGFERVYNLSGGYKTYQFIHEAKETEDVFTEDVVHPDDQLYPEGDSYLT